MMVLRAQASFEFMVVFTAMLMLFLIVFAVSGGGTANLEQARDSVLAQRDAYAVAAAMNYVYLAGDGASYGLLIRNTAGEGNITVSRYAATSARPGGSASAPLLDGSTDTGSLGGPDALISNRGGEIHVED